MKSQQLFRDASSYSGIDFLANAFSFHVMYHLFNPFVKLIDCTVFGNISIMLVLTLILVRSVQRVVGFFRIVLILKKDEK